MLKIPHLALTAALSLGVVACKSKKPEAPKTGELTEVEKADLRKKALENYKKLVERYPDSEYAARAEERVRALTPPKK